MIRWTIQNIIQKTIQSRTLRTIAGRYSVLAVLAWGLLPNLAAPVAAQDVTFENLMAATHPSALVGAEGALFVGTSAEGVLVFDRETLTERDRWNSGPELSGNQISQMCWTGRFLWIASLDNGLTRVQYPAAEVPAFRQYRSNLGSAEVSCVTGTVVEGSEIVYYGMVGAGVGRISDGIPGVLFSADQNGLLSDDINDLQLVGTDLFIATDLGVSLLRGEIATTQNEGLSSLVVNDFCLDGSGNLIAGTDTGIYVWDPEGESWTLAGDIGRPVQQVAWQDGGPIWAVGYIDNEDYWLVSDGRVAYDQGGSYHVEYGPYAKTSLIYADEEVYVAGRYRADGMASQTGRVFVARYLADYDYQTTLSDRCLVHNPEGLALQRDGTLWIGSWLADAISSWDENRGWRHIYEVADADNDFNGLINQGANVLCMAEDYSGAVWAGQFTAGAVRIDPQDMSTEHVRPGDVPMDGGMLLNMVAHPDGPMFFLHDLDGGMVDVLLDPVNWEVESNWMSLPETSDGIGTEGLVWEALVERRDVIWFAVEGRGLVRWDINGDYAGPDDALTWTDWSDDSWSDPVTVFADTNGVEVSDPAKVRGLALAADGSIWAAGENLVRFTYNDFTGEATWWEHWKTKQASYENGLVGGDLVDVAVDVNDDVWILGKTGLNRLRWREGEAIFDTYLDQTNYWLYPNNQLFYLAGVFSELPGQEYRRMEIDESGTRLLVAGDQGTSLISVQEGYETDRTAESKEVYLYPNPFRPGVTAERLSVGGFGDDVVEGETALVEILNLEGQIVYRDRAVEPDTEFWSGRSRPGDLVTTGVYLVRIQWRGQNITRTLAIVN